MAMAVEEIVEETRHWPPEKVGQLVGILTKDMHSSDPGVEAAWKKEIGKRIEEIQSGRVQPVPLDQSLANIRKIAGL